MIRGVIDFEEIFWSECVSVGGGVDPEVLSTDCTVLVSRTSALPMYVS